MIEDKASVPAQEEDIEVEEIEDTKEPRKKEVQI